jgi:hypothetical protein
MEAPHGALPAARSLRGTATAVASTAAAVVMAASVVLVGLLYGTWAVGGSDSACYGLMAEAFARGELQPTTALAREAPWPEAARTFAPAGFLPSPTVGDGASPICAPGFALLLAPFRWVAGRDGIFLVTPLAGGWLVWLAFRLATALGDRAAGVAAATTVATMPILLFQVAQPMNDVLVAALWMAVLLAAFQPDPVRAWSMGAWTGLALLVRPNLAPAAAVVLLWLVIVSLGARRHTGLARRNVAAFVLASAPGLIVLLALNHALYGHPMQSGYGPAGDLFSVTHVVPNIATYAATLLGTQLGLPFIGVLALLVAPTAARPHAWLIAGVCAAVVSVYLLYRPFDEWWYVRFLLPALAPACVLAVVVLAAACARPRGARGRAVACGVIVCALAAVAVTGVMSARDRQAFELQRLERRFRETARVVRDQLPAHAVLITVWQSGTVRYHAGRSAVLWDSLHPESLDAAVAWLGGRGLEPYILVERWEEPLFRERFATAAQIGDLDWPPRFDLIGQVRIFNPADRGPYMAGQPVPTTFVITR